MHAQRGLTFVEIMLVISLSAIIVAFSLPSYHHLHTKIEHNRLLTGIDQWLTHAKMTALTHNTTVTLCQSVQGKSCQQGNWSHGSIAFIDYNGNHIKDPEDHIIAKLPALPPGHTLTLNAFRSNRYFQFQPQGASTDNGSFTYCANDSPVRQTFIISQHGRIRKEHDIVC